MLSKRILLVTLLVAFIVFIVALPPRDDASCQRLSLLLTVVSMVGDNPDEALSMLRTKSNDEDRRSSAG
jgi:hypothetical protein